VAAPPSARPRTQLCPETQLQTVVTLGEAEPLVPPRVGVWGGAQLHSPLQTGGATGGEPLQAPRQAASVAPSASAAPCIHGLRRGVGIGKRYFATW
jgi:hypothetical protein